MPAGQATKTHEVKPTTGNREDKDKTNGTGPKSEEHGSATGTHRITAVEIQKVQNSIEQCLQLYMTRQDVVATLLHQANIEARFTSLVWQKLEEQNPEFFRAYYTRLKLKDQIVLFNNMLEHHAQLMQKLQGGYQNAGNDPQGNPLSLGQQPFPGSGGMQGQPGVVMNGIMMGSTPSLGFHYNPMEQNPFTSMPGQHPGDINGGMHMMGMVPNHMGGTFPGGGSAGLSDLPFGAGSVGSGLGAGGIGDQGGGSEGPLHMGTGGLGATSSPLPSTSTSYNSNLLGPNQVLGEEGAALAGEHSIGGEVPGADHHPLSPELANLGTGINQFANAGNGSHVEDHTDDMLSHLPRNFSFTDLSMELTTQINDGSDHTALSLFPTNVPSSMESLELGNKQYRLPRNFSLSDMSLEFDRET